MQAEADRNRGRVPEFVTEANGKGTVESFTVIYGRNDEVEHGVVMMRTSDDARALARVPASDGATLAHLLNMDRTPVGTSAISSRRRMACWSGGWADTSHSCGAKRSVPTARGEAIYAPKRWWARRKARLCRPYAYPQGRRG